MSAVLSLNTDIATIPAQSAARETFEARFRIDLASLLGGIATERIVINTITSGSIAVNFTVLPAAGAEPTVSAAALTAAFSAPGVMLAGVQTTAAIVTVHVADALPELEPEPAGPEPVVGEPEPIDPEEPEPELNPEPDPELVAKLAGESDSFVMLAAATASGAFVAVGIACAVVIYRCGRRRDHELKQVAETGAGNRSQSSRRTQSLHKIPEQQRTSRRTSDRIQGSGRHRQQAYLETDSASTVSSVPSRRSGPEDFATVDQSAAQRVSGADKHGARNRRSVVTSTTGAHVSPSQRRDGRQLPGAGQPTAGDDDRTAEHATSKLRKSVRKVTAMTAIVAAGDAVDVVIMGSGARLNFRMPRHKHMRKMLKVWSARQNCNVEEQVFTYNGFPVGPTDTPEALGMNFGEIAILTAEKMVASQMAQVV